MPDPKTIGADIADRIEDLRSRRGIEPMSTEEFDRLQREEMLAERYERARTYTDGRIPARYQGAEADEPAIAKWVTDLVEATGAMPSSRLALGPSLLILGPTGVGKTHAAFGAIRGLAAAGIAVRWEAGPAADLYARLRPRSGTDSEEEFRKIAGAPLLLVDDLGAAKGSEWTEEVTYRLVNSRYEAMLPTLITSNVPPNELKPALGDRVASRLVEMCDRVVLKGTDRRRTTPRPDVPTGQRYATDGDEARAAARHTDWWDN